MDLFLWIVFPVTIALWIIGWILFIIDGIRERNRCMKEIREMIIFRNEYFTKVLESSKQLSEATKNYIEAIKKTI
jgi:hypothetical protein